MVEGRFGLMNHFFFLKFNGIMDFKVFIILYTFFTLIIKGKNKVCKTTKKVIHIRWLFKIPYKKLSIFVANLKTQTHEGFNGICQANWYEKNNFNVQPI